MRLRCGVEPGDQPLDPIRRMIWWAKGGRYDVANLTSIYLFVMDHCQIVKVLDGVVIYQCAYLEETGDALAVGA